MIQRSSCLGTRLSALADGSLPDDVRDRALAHVAGCVACRQELDVERLVVDRVRALPAPAPSDLLVARLLALGDTGGPLPPRAGRVPGTARQPSAVLVGLTPVPRPAARPVSAAARTRPAGRREVRRSRQVLVAAAGVLGVGVIAVTALGSAAPSPGPAVLPAVDQLTVRNGTVQNPFSDAGLVRLRSGPAASPTAVPALSLVELGR